MITTLDTNLLSQEQTLEVYKIFRSYHEEGFSTDQALQMAKTKYNTIQNFTTNNTETQSV